MTTLSLEVLNMFSSTFDYFFWSRLMLEYDCRKELNKLLKLLLVTELIQSIIKPEIEVQKIFYAGTLIVN